MTERERAMAERIASRLCEPHYRRRIIEMTIHRRRSEETA